jgi:hypothetical protein
MPLNSVIRGSAFVQAARLRRLACFLLAESPAEAEANARVPPEVLDVLTRGNGVIRFEGPLGDSHYMIVRNGTRYLTSERPDDVDEGEIRSVRLARGGPRNLLRRFRRASRRLHEADPLLHKAFRFEEIGCAIDAEFPRGSAAALLRTVRPFLLLAGPEAPAPPADLADSDEQASAWLDVAIKYLKREYALNRVAGDTVREILAALLYLRLSPDPARRIDLHRQATGFGALVVPGTPSRWLPSPHLEGYLLSPGLTVSEALIPARQLAIFLTRSADEQRRAASGLPMMEQFHGQLFGALLGYRVAQEVFAVIERVLSPVPADVIPPRLVNREELRARARHCEEMRVHIAGSLATAAGVRTSALDLWSRASLRDYLTWLAGVPLLSAERDITDLALRLYIPDVVRVWLKGWLWMFHPGSDRGRAREGARRVKDVLELLEQRSNERAVFGEPPLVWIGYGWLAADARKRGDRKQASEFAQKARPPAHQTISFPSLQSIIDGTAW